MPDTLLTILEKLEQLLSNRRLSSILMLTTSLLFTVSTFAQRVGVNVPDPISTLHVNAVDNSSPIRIENRGQTKQIELEIKK